MHFLLNMPRSDFNLAEPEKVDAVVSAELPDKETDPEMLASVTRHMARSSCGNFGLNRPCMVPKRRKDSNGIEVAGDLGTECSK